MKYCFFLVLNRILPAMLQVLTKYHLPLGSKMPRSQMLFIEGCGVCKSAQLGNTNRAHRILDSVSLASLEHTNAKASN